MVKRRPANIIAANDVASDASAFRAAVRDVRPLTQTPPPAGLAKLKPRARPRKAAPPPLENLDETMPLVASGLPDETAVEAGAVHTGAVHTGAVHTGAVHRGAAQAVTGDGPLSFQRAGVRLQVMRRLRRGLYPIEDELDLHGLTQTAARARLADFLARSRDGGCRCVRIIHGKGYRSGVRGPVLKTAVNLWLRRHTDVMAFVSARAIDGGAGAMYVLLRA
jgi:DNA-nicking Smr family endonuclease